jgi:hypothetical protein
MALARAQTGPRQSHLLHLFLFPRPTRDSVCRLWMGRVVSISPSVLVSRCAGVLRCWRQRSGGRLSQGRGTVPCCILHCMDPHATAHSSRGPQAAAMRRHEDAIKCNAAEVAQARAPFAPGAGLCRSVDLSVRFAGPGQGTRAWARQRSEEGRLSTCLPLALTLFFSFTGSQRPSTERHEVPP